MLNVVVVFSLPPFLSYEENEMGIYEIPQTKRDSVMQSVCNEGSVRQKDYLNEIIHSCVSI